MCRGGDEERAPSSPLKLEEELSMKMSVNLHFYTKRPLFILRRSNFGPYPPFPLLEDSFTLVCFVLTTFFY